MKYLFFLLVLLATQSTAQTIGKIKWKSKAGVSYIYTGQIKDGKPHGKGFAVSDSAGEKIFGSFENGDLEGRETVLYKTGKIMTGQWKNGYANGQGVTLDFDKYLYYGNYEKGELKDGAIVITSYDEIRIVARMGKVGYDGRVIRIRSDGTTIADNYYVDHSKNGQGYQYDAEKQSMDEGFWENNEWKMATTGNYHSFMRSVGFGSSIDDNVITIYSNRSGEGFLQDTCFLFDKKKNNRFFGYFNRGNLKNGIEIVGDSTCLIGQFDNNGKQGLCVAYSRDRALAFANYKDDQFDGDGILINLEQQMIIDGSFSKGLLSGNMSILNQDGGLTIGYYENGQLRGEALLVHPDGSSAKGIYVNGELKETKKLNLASGEKINTHPKDIGSAVNFLVKEYENDFKTINSEQKSISDNETFQISYSDALNSLYSFPGAAYNRILPQRQSLGDTKHNEFTCGLLVTNNFAEVKKQYDNLCRQVSACSITSLQKGKSMKLIAKMRPLVPNPEEGRLASLFTIPVYNGNKNTALIRVMVEKNYDGNYQLTLDVISKWE